MFINNKYLLTLQTVLISVSPCAVFLATENTKNFKASQLVFFAPLLVAKGFKQFSQKNDILKHQECKLKLWKFPE